jgi:UDP-N-acetylmuramoyl-L-alanyl-D-glutamate--2,6-diaminopimelate ligase
MSVADGGGAMEGVRLDELVAELRGRVELLGDGATRVRGVHHDSRAVEAGDLFVARRGGRADGMAFVDAAVKRGAVAIAVERGAVGGAALPLPTLVVDDANDALAFAAAAVYGHPTFSLDVVGVTGTNGKTTTTHLVRAAVDGALGGERCGTIGTVGHAFGSYRVAAVHTTPEADEIARVAAEMQRRGASHVAMEVSSHALALGRVRAVRFRIAAFTNLTQDHLDFHGSMSAYLESKARLFTELAPGAAVINIADPAGANLARRVRSPLVRVSGVVGADADVVPTAVSMDERGIEATVRTPNGEIRVRSRLVGAHNVDNLALALGIVYALDLDVARAADALAEELGAPGRLERCDAVDDDLVALVDYAHTPDALARILAGVRKIATGRVWCVFGAGGDRDATKRAPMGRAVGEVADVAVVTNDNPRTEDPTLIARDVVAGLRETELLPIAIDDLRSGARGYAVELDRAKAIDLAVGSAASGDVVVVAGKGHEDYQIVGSERRHFDDREETRRALAVRRAARQGVG